MSQRPSQCKSLFLTTLSPELRLSVYEFLFPDKFVSLANQFDVAEARDTDWQWRIRFLNHTCVTVYIEAWPICLHHLHILCGEIRQVLRMPPKLMTGLKHLVLDVLYLFGARHQMEKLIEALSSLEDLIFNYGYDGWCPPDWWRMVELPQEIYDETTRKIGEDLTMTRSFWNSPSSDWIIIASSRHNNVPLEGAFAGKILDVLWKHAETGKFKIIVKTWQVWYGIEGDLVDPELPSYRFMIHTTVEFKANVGRVLSRLVYEEDPNTKTCTGCGIKHNLRRRAEDD